MNNYTFKITEGTVKSELYHQLKLNHIQCVVEAYIKEIRGRIDIGIIKNNQLIAIIEVKNYKTNNPFKYNTKQIKKYQQLNIPVIGCSSYNNIPKILKEIINLYRKD